VIRTLIVAALAACSLAAPLGAQGLEDYDYANLELRAVGLVLGGAFPSRAESRPSFGVVADFGFLGPHVRMWPSITYWGSRLEQGEVDRLANQILEICRRQPGAQCPLIDLGEIRISDLAVNLDAHFVPQVDARLEPYAGAGLGLHFLNGSGELIDGTFVEDFLDTLSPGLNLIAGLGTRVLAPISLFAEARYVLTPDIRFGSLSLGGTWTLPAPVRAPIAVVPVTPRAP
jgi:hypothetical protein